MAHRPLAARQEAESALATERERWAGIAPLLEAVAAYKRAKIRLNETQAAWREASRRGDGPWITGPLADAYNEADEAWEPARTAMWSAILAVDFAALAAAPDAGAEAGKE